MLPLQLKDESGSVTAAAEPDMTAVVRAAVPASATRRRKRRAAPRTVTGCGLRLMRIQDPPRNERQGPAPRAALDLSTKKVNARKPRPDRASPPKGGSGTGRPS